MSLLVHTAVFAALAWWSWRKSLDPLIDFGRELYVPWQITEGRVLYRDLASLFGPLSPYVNAGFFRLFGVSLTTLIVCNLTIFALMLAAIHHILRVASGVPAATTATLCVMLVFGFSQYGPVGNYNFVSPYSHEATHGMALSVALMVALHHGFRGNRWPWFALSGTSFGLVLLTKPEVAVAAAVAACVGFVAAAASQQVRGPRLWRNLLVFAGGSAAAPLLFFWYFSLHLSIVEALGATAGAWKPLWTADVIDTIFYRRVSGLDHPVANTGRMLLVFAGHVTFVAIAVLAARDAATRSGAGWSAARQVLWMALFAVAVATAWYTIPRALPLTTAAILGWLFRLFARPGVDRAPVMRMLPLLMWGTFALALLSKIALNTGVAHYGFYLALPATTLLVVALTGFIPERLSRRYSPRVGTMFLRIATCMVAAGIAPYLVLSTSWYRTKTVAVGTGRDRFYASNRSELWQGPAAQEALTSITELTTLRDEVAVLPEGAMLNYLSRRASPLMVVNLMPPELRVFGERGVLDSLERGSPALVFLVQKDMTEYGYPPFGSDARYGLAIAKWLDAHYERVKGISPDPATGKSRIVVLMRRPG